MVPIGALEAPAPAAERMLLLPPDPERQVIVRGPQIRAVLEEVEIDREPVAMERLRDALSDLREARGFLG